MNSDDFARLIEGVLSRDLDDTIYYGFLTGSAPPADFAEYAAHIRTVVERQFGERTADEKEPPTSPLPIPATGRHGGAAGQARTDDRARDDSLFLLLQAWRSDRRSTGEWRRYLDAFDHPERWLAIARADEADGMILRTNAALAAARWLDPEGTRDATDAIVAARPAGLPARVVAQPDPTWRPLPFAERHWRAWAKKRRALVDLPTLLVASSDENFSVRTRVYRSLGQLQYPTSIQCLHEATHDPHFFARAQAVRSLGWCLDPTCYRRLVDLSRVDPHPEVQRTAKKSLQRIVGYWTHFGDWSRLASDGPAMLAVARAFLADGLREVALNLLDSMRDDVDEAEALFEELDAREECPDAPERDYGYWFAEAQREEAAITSSTDSDRELASAITGSDAAACMRALLVVSRHARVALRPEVEARCSAEGDVGWAARRVMHCLGWSVASRPLR